MTSYRRIAASISAIHYCTVQASVLRRNYRTIPRGPQQHAAYREIQQIEMLRDHLLAGLVA